MRFTTKAILALVVFLALGTQVFGDVPMLIVHQGRLTTPAGDPVPDGSLIRNVIGLSFLLCCNAVSLLSSVAPSVRSGESNLVWESTGFAKPTEGELVDHKLDYTWDGADWSLSSRTTYGWDGQGRPTTVLDEDWQVSAYVNDYLTTTSYDGTGATQTLTQDWEGGVWVNDWLSTFENDGEQRPIVIVTQDWDGATWVNESRSTITYESGLSMAEMIVEIWTGGVWVETFKSVYTYDGGNVAEWTSYTKDGDDWVPVVRTTFTYSGGRLEMEVTESWFAILPDPFEWTPILRTTYNYEGDNLVEKLFENYSAYVPPIGWTTTGRNTLEYDGQDRLTVEVYESYFETALGWLNSGKTEYFYDGGEFLCGDADGSSSINISDAVYLIQYIFAEGPPPDPVAVADSDCSGGINMSDVVYLIQYIFAEGPDPCDPDGDGTPDC